VKINKFILRFIMSRRYKKIKEDMPLLSGEDRGRYFVCGCSAAKLLFAFVHQHMSFIFFYLHISPYIYKQAELAKV